MNSSVNASPMPNSLARRRRGLSLVELLVVVGIVVTLAAITLPSLRELLKDQKVTQASRQVQAFFEAAKARAIANGRPVGILLDRLSYAGANSNQITNSTCLRLSIVEVLPPYCGDIQGATATLDCSAGLPGYANRAYLPLTTCPTAASIISSGDLISFGDNPLTFMVVGTPTITTYNSNPHVTLVLSNPTEAKTEPIWPLVSALDLPFRVFRKPTKSLTGGLDLPKGICVDLTASGVGPFGRNFSPDWIVGDPSWSSVPAADYKGIYIVFDANGGVERIYKGFNVGGVITFNSEAPTSTIHLLLGKTDQVVPPTLLTPFDGTTIQTGRDLATSNLMDSESLWVSINPFTGAIYSSPVPEPVLPNPVGLFGLDFRTRQAREFAIQGVARGGR
ncbi:MAG: hypothetical protein J0M26_19990 [Planctomycetes bacterium]|nr:hypothetical protein [Planctomycetota bacterium]